MDNVLRHPSLGDGPAVNPPSATAQPASAAAPDYARMLAGVARGDRAAEDELMRTLSTPLEIVLRHRARGVEGVDDLRQEALMVVLQAAREGRLHDPPALVGFALETARRLALNAQRKLLRHRTEDDAEVGERAVDAEPGAGQVLDRERLRGCVGTVLASMPNPRDRQLLHGYYIEELASADLQARFDVDSAQLGRLLYRARKRFSDLWQALSYDPPEP